MLKEVMERTAGAAADVTPRPTVLVVDDHATNRVLLTAWLTGHTVLEAVDGQAALDLLETTTPDLIILDVMMPGLSGIETCRRIKARPTEGYLPVLLLTALGDQENRNAGLEAGADDFLSRPVDRRELLLRVKTFLRLRQQDLQIRAQVRELRKLDALKEDLVSLVTHDLRNALGGLMVLMEAIQYAGATCTNEDLASLLAAASRMGATLDDMMRIKLLEDGALPLNLAPTRVDELVNGAVTLVEPAARARDLTIRRVVDPRASVVCDTMLLQRSLFNLLQNAVKYSRRGDEIEIRARAVDGVVEFEVHDRGPGVAEDVREYLFEKFAGVAVRRAPSRTGNGLGLFLVQLVASAHHGNVSVLAREGGGSTFRLVLPVA
jgi:signal transduction histidine kinase